MVHGTDSQENRNAINNLNNYFDGLNRDSWDSQDCQDWLRYIFFRVDVPNPDHL